MRHYLQTIMHFIGRVLANKILLDDPHSTVVFGRDGAQYNVPSCQVKDVCPKAIIENLKDNSDLRAYPKIN